MRKQQEMVRQFHEKCGAEINSRPYPIGLPHQELRFTLVREELVELGEAMGYIVDDDHCGLVTKVREVDLTKTADAIGDLLYVVLGAAVSFGIDIESVFEEIHRSNMTKFIDGHRREDGKWVKGPSYDPARIADVLANQSPLP